MNWYFGSTPSFIVMQNCGLVIDQVCAHLKNAGFQILPTFNLKTSLPSGKNRDHQPEHQKCQMVILLVFGKESSPVTLSLFGEEVKTTVTVNDIKGDTSIIAGVLASKLNKNFLIAEGDHPCE